MPIILKRGTESNRPSLFLRAGEPIFTTDNRRLYIGSGASDGGKELTFGQLTASLVSASKLTVGEITASKIIAVDFQAQITSMSLDHLEVTSTINATCSQALTSSYLLGSISSASYATNAATASYLSSSGQNVALGDILSTDSTANSWMGNQSVTGSGIFVQRSAMAARATLLSAGTTVNGNGSYNISVASGTLSSLGPTLNGHFGSWQVQTYGGSTWSTSARMMMQTSGDHNEGSRPTDIIFQSTPSGSTTLQTRLKVNGSGVQVTGSLGVNGPITTSAINVQTLVVTTISSSVEYVSGSTIHGSLSSNTHQFTGSVNVTGSTNLYGKYTSTVNGASNSSIVYSYGGRAAVGLYSANGTEASPSGWTNGSEMGKVLFYSYGSTGFGGASSQIATIADGDHSDANKGTLISIQGTSSGSNTLTEWARFRNGNLGIGTTTPAARLDLGASLGVVQYVYKDGSANAGLGINLSGNSGELSLFAGATGDGAGRISFGRRRVDTGTYTERMVVEGSSGAVGIGVTSPQAILHVSSSDSSYSALFSGKTNAVRFQHNTAGTSITGVDRTGMTSYQPITLGGSYIALAIAGSEKVRVDASGSVGINTASPSGILDVAKPSSGGRFQVVNEGANVYNVIASRNAADSAYLPLTIRSGPVVFAPGTGSITIDATSNLKYNNATIESYFGGDGTGALVGTTSNHGLSLYTANVARVMVSTSGAVRFINYGAGTLVTDSSGNITATSDGRMKDVSGSFDRGLDAIVNLSPKVYHWKEESGLNVDDVNVGLIAQEVLPHIPEAIGYKDDKYTMSDRPIIAALINAVKELKADNDQLRARIEALES